MGLDSIERQLPPLQADGGRRRILKGVFGVSGVVPTRTAAAPSGSCMTAILGPSGKLFALCYLFGWLVQLV